MRLLFVGDHAPFLTTRARLDALRGLDLQVESLDPPAYLRTGRRALDRITFWTLLTPPVFAFNRALWQRCRELEPHVIWIEKGVFVFPRSLRALRRRSRALLVYHNTDDWRAKTRLQRLHWRYLLRGLRDYDLHVTSNLHNVHEFRSLGLPQVHHMELAANRAVQPPREVDPESRRGLSAQAGFVGHWEPETERLLLALAAAGVELKIFGGGWERAEARERLGAALQDRLVWGPEYALAIQSFDVNLGIVSKWNRNHTASRSFQIPALGGFLLHERNELMSRYFREGVEAEFFASAEELVEKCRHYLDHPEERRRIAAAGQRRCLESGYFEEDRVRELLPTLTALVEERFGAARLSPPLPAAQESQA